jgi:hypothetical protein
MNYDKGIFFHFSRGAGFAFFNFQKLETFTTRIEEMTNGVHADFVIMGLGNPQAEFLVTRLNGKVLLMKPAIYLLITLPIVLVCRTSSYLNKLQKKT